MGLTSRDLFDEDWSDCTHTHTVYHNAVSSPIAIYLLFTKLCALSLSHSLNSNCGFPQFRRLAATRGNYAFMSEWGRADIDFCHSLALSTLSRGIVIHIVFANASVSADCRAIPWGFSNYCVLKLFFIISLPQVVAISSGCNPTYRGGNGSDWRVAFSRLPSTCRYRADRRRRENATFQSLPF